MVKKMSANIAICQQFFTPYLTLLGF